jgi:hypothetical protein
VDLKEKLYVFLYELHLSSDANFGVRIIRFMSVPYWTPTLVSECGTESDGPKDLTCFYSFDGILILKRMKR